MHARTPLRFFVCFNLSSAPGAAAVCLTDGDEGSLRLARRNVSANLLPAPGQHPRAPPCDKSPPEKNKKTTATIHRSSIASVACRKVNDKVTTRASELDRDNYGVDEAAAMCSAPEGRRHVGTEGAAVGPDASHHVGKPSSPPAGVGKTKGSFAPPGAAALGAGSPESDARMPSSFSAPGTTSGDDNSVSIGTDRSDGGGGVGVGVEDCPHQRQRGPLAVFVRKLRWGFPADMEASLGGEGGPWEVVIGSDIAALPYASAHGDLLRTIVFLVNGGSAAAFDSESAAELNAENATKLDGGNGAEVYVQNGTNADNAIELKGEGEERAAEPSRPRACRRGGPGGGVLSDADSVAGHEIGTVLSPTPLASPLPPLQPPPPQPRRRQQTSPPVASERGRGDEGKGRKVLVLLAHKRRHVCEEPFFEDLRAELGESSCREIGEDDVHPDFRGMGIRLLAFEVDVPCRRASLKV